MRKKILTYTISIFFYILSVSTFVKAEDANPAVSVVTSHLLNYEQVPLEKDNSNAFEWLKRVKFGVEAGSDIKPIYFLESVQPLLGTEENNTVLFNHARIAGRDYRTVYNTGLGLRRILKDTYLLGTNLFYDFQDTHKHHRAGLGFEAFTDRGLEARVNTYFRVSSIREVNNASGVQEFEKVANGLDWEIGGQIPYFSFLKFYGGGHWYSFEKFSNKVGWDMRFEYNPFKNSRLVFKMLDDNKRSKAAYRFEGTITIALTSFKPSDMLRDVHSSIGEAFPNINLREKVLERVIRDFDITVIKQSKNAGGLVVEAGRS